MAIQTIFSARHGEFGEIFFDLEMLDDEFGLERVTLPYRADDPYSGEVGKALAAWIDEHKAEIAPFAPPAPPTADQLRAQMAPLFPRQLRLGLVREGISLLTVTAALDGLPEGQAKEEAEIEWEYATSYNRLAPALLTIAAAIGLTPEQVDTMWEKALLI